MLAAYAASTDPASPLDGLVVGDRPEPRAQQGWSVVRVRAASVNRHDLWSLAGVGLPAERLPMILGTDAAGLAPDGSPVVVHAVIGSGSGPGQGRSLLSELHQGTMAELVAVPTANLVPLPQELSFVEAACLPTAYLTAYRMLFTSAGARPGQRVLVQGAGGGVATAAVLLGAAAGLEVFVTSRDAGRRRRAVELGAAAALGPGERLPARVDVVIETVGAATWGHSIRSVRPGGVVVVAGATSGDPDRAELTRIFFNEIRVLGATMGGIDDLTALLALMARTGLRPVLDTVLPLAQARSGLERMASGAQFGKIVLTP